MKATEKARNATNSSNLLRLSPLSPPASSVSSSRLISKISIIMKEFFLEKLNASKNSAEEALKLTSHFSDLFDERKYHHTEEMLNFLQNDSVSKTFCNKKECENSRESETSDEFENGDWDPLILWFLPKICCIREIEWMVREAGLQHISSIGCGSGLLEWIITGITGLEVNGYEVNEDWWKIHCTQPRFIPHIYADSTNKNSSIPVEQHHALLFSYFNHGKYFKNYLEQYKGNVLIVIGPVDGRRSSDPSPLVFLNSSEWTLCRAHVKNNNDIICCYKRNMPNLIKN